MLKDCLIYPYPGTRDDRSFQEGKLCHDAIMTTRFEIDPRRSGCRAPITV